MLVGLVVNPIAGMGGAVGLMGTDGRQRLSEAVKLGAQRQSNQRCVEFLRSLNKLDYTNQSQLFFLTPPGDLGESCLAQSSFTYRVSKPTEFSNIADANCSAQHTIAAINQFKAERVDLIVFVGGDGTARDVLSAAPDIPVLGIPAGVKMHSGVFAVTPRAAASVLNKLVHGELVAQQPRDVRDFAESQAEEDFAIMTYGELLVPDVGEFLQHTKVGGMESEPLVVEEICAEILERTADAKQIILGPGSTCFAIKTKLGIGQTLRGFDVFVRDGQAIFNADQTQLLHIVENEADLHVVVSFTRAQGFLFGRGNQQLSHACIQALRWPDAVSVVGTRTKLASLQGRPLLVDTGSVEVDARLCGLVSIVAGYEDQLLHRIAIDYT